MAQLRNKRQNVVDSITTRIKSAQIGDKLKSLQLRKRYGTLTEFIRRRPIGSFLIALFVLFLIILLSSLVFSPKTGQTVQAPVKVVSIYRIGSFPKVTVQAKIEKSGVVKLVAQTSGVVSLINVSEGNTVTKGQDIIDLSTNYNGGNAPDIQVDIAGAQYKNVLDTYQEQKDVINRQRDLANQNLTNTQMQAQIGAQVVDQTSGTLGLDQQIIQTLQNNLNNYQASNSAGMNNSQILQTQQLLSQYQSATIQLQQSLTNSQYQANPTNPPNQIASTQHDITLKQIDIQEKSLDLNKEVMGLQAEVAQINAALMHPAAPFSGSVQRIYVKEGQVVQPGTALLLLSGDKSQITAVVNVSESLAHKVSQAEPSILTLGNSTYSEVPIFVSTEATDNNTFSVLYTIPDNYTSSVSDGDYITVQMPIGMPDTGSTIPFVPLDAVYQTQDQAYLFVLNHGRAQSRTVVLGQVYGQFVSVESGLNAGDQVITTRNVVTGDRVTVQ